MSSLVKTLSARRALKSLLLTVINLWEDYPEFDVMASMPIMVGSTPIKKKRAKIFNFQLRFLNQVSADLSMGLLSKACDSEKGKLIVPIIPNI